MFRKSPCRECPLLLEDKNNQTCAECQKRKEYLLSMEGYAATYRPIPSPLTHAKLMETQKYIHIERIKQRIAKEKVDGRKNRSDRKQKDS